MNLDQISIAIQALVAGKPFNQENVEAALTDEATRRLRGDRANSLDWRHSMVDFLKILNLDNSWQARRDLAQNMGYTGALTKEDSFVMNMWLHREIFNRLANHYET